MLWMVNAIRVSRVFHDPGKTAEYRRNPEVLDAALTLFA
jgi:hypothetical protein